MIEGQSIANEPGVELVGKTFAFTRDASFNASLEKASGSLHEFKRGETVFIATKEHFKQGAVLYDKYLVFYSVFKVDKEADRRGIIRSNQEIKEVYIYDFGNVLPLCLTESKRKADGNEVSQSRFLSSEVVCFRKGDSLRKKLELLRTIIPITEQVRRAAVRVLELAEKLQYKDGEIIAPSPKYDNVPIPKKVENDPSMIGLERAAKVVLAVSGDHFHADTFSDGDAEDQMEYLILAAVAKVKGVINEAETRGYDGNGRASASN